MRATELIQNKLEKKEKFTVEDIRLMQKDTVDVYARQILPVLVNITESMLLKYIPKNKLKQNNIKTCLDELKNWGYDMKSKSRAAVIYNVWETYIYNSWFNSFPKGEKETLLDSFTFDNFAITQILSYKNQHNLNQ